MPVDSVHLERGDHAAHLHESYAEQKSVVLPFFRAGLEGKERCIYVASDHSIDDWYFELQAYGIDVQTERQNGALQVVPRTAWRTLDRTNSIVQARRALSLIEEGAGYEGLRIAFDAAWALNPPVPAATGSVTGKRPQT
jgi:hypothetical protein